MSDPVVVVAIPTDDRRSDRLFGQLARALSSSPRGSGIATDQRLGESVARLVVRPPGLLQSVDPQLGSGRRCSIPVPRAPISSLDDGKAHYGVLVVSPTSSVSPQGPVLTPSVPMAVQGCRVDCRTFWVPRSGGGLWSARVFRTAYPGSATASTWPTLAGAALAQHWASLLGRSCTFRDLSLRTARRAWSRVSTDPLPREAWTEMTAEQAAVTVSIPRPPASVRTTYPASGHLAVFGTSGAGKTSFLVELGAEGIRRGASVVALDLHGDLVPGIVERLTPPLRERVLAIDVTERPVLGINVLDGATPLDGDRSVAHVVAALKRLSPDGEGIYWGFRMERIFESFLRLVQAEGGSLRDVAVALQSADRREALRATTRRPDLVGFLDELGTILRRHPDFLWPAAARLSKLVMVPALQELLAPVGTAPPWEEALDSGRSLLIRLPFAEIGSEAAALASTLLLTRVYLAHASRYRDARAPRPLLLLLDEAHEFSPRLLAEVLTEGRKFGVRVVVSTQYPQRLAPEVEHAVRGATATQVCFRVPTSNALPTARWLGVDRALPLEQLTSLPTGSALLVGRRIEPLIVPPPPGDPHSALWKEAVMRTRAYWGGEADSGDVEGGPTVEASDEALLLAVLSLREEGREASDRLVVQRATASTLGGGDPVDLTARWSRIVRRRWVLPSPNGWTLSSAGVDALGFGRMTGATRESSEHRSLLVEAFRIFARKGYRLDIVRQGRFDTTLPDARLELLGRAGATGTPEEFARRIDRARTGWAWRFFCGRDVNVEAEVSGALRAERIRHGCRKAMRDGAYVLFLVGDASRARRVKSVLHDLSLGRDRAQVWTIAAAARTRAVPSGREVE